MIFPKYFGHFGQTWAKFHSKYHVPLKKLFINKSQAKIVIIFWYYYVKFFYYLCYRIKVVQNTFKRRDNIILYSLIKKCLISLPLFCRCHLIWNIVAFLTGIATQEVLTFENEDSQRQRMFFHLRNLCHLDMSCIDWRHFPWATGWYCFDHTELFMTHCVTHNQNIRARGDRWTTRQL